MPGAVFPVRVYYEDTDTSGVVYHANYLRWFERARTEWLRGYGFGQAQLLKEAGVGFTLASINVRYLRPARLDDELIVVTRVSYVGRASIRFEQEIQYARQGNELLAQATVRIGCVSVPGFQPQRIPAALERALNEDSGHDG